MDVLPKQTTETKGDVNNDGLVNISDVTALVNIILGKTEQGGGTAETTTIYWGGTNDYGGPTTDKHPDAQPIPADFDYKHLGHSGITTGNTYSNTIEAGHKVQWVAISIDWGIYIFKEDGMNTDALDDGNSYAVTMEDGEYQVVATKDYGTGSLVQGVTTSFTVKKGIPNNFK